MLRSATTERAVLGAILMEPRLAKVAVSKLDRNCFGDPERHLFEAIKRLEIAGKAVDMVSLGEQLKADSTFDLVGGNACLMSIIDGVPTIAHFESHIDTLLDYSSRRAIESAGSATVVLANDTGIDISDVRTQSLAVLKDAISSKANAKAVVTAESVADDMLHRATTNEPLKGVVRSGISIVDNVFGGLWPLFMVLAARPSVGKSTLALNIVRRVAMSGKKVLLFALEDSVMFTMWRLYSSISGVPLEAIIGRRTTNEQKEQLKFAADLTKQFDLHIVDGGAMSSEQVCSICYDYDDSDLIVIDHMGQLKERIGNNLYESTTHAFRNVANLAKELEKPVLAVHQLNRQSAADESPRMPRLTDLRQSGEIEQLARVVWLLHRPGYYDESKDPNEATLIVAKNAHSRTGKAQLYCDMERMYIGDER